MRSISSPASGSRQSLDDGKIALQRDRRAVLGDERPLRLKAIISRPCSRINHCDRDI
jgi:hypothetical protein